MGSHFSNVSDSLSGSIGLAIWSKNMTPINNQGVKGGDHQKREAWNKGKLVGQKPPLKPKDIWAIRIYLQNAHAVRDLAIDSKLRGCDLVSLRVLALVCEEGLSQTERTVELKRHPARFETRSSDVILGSRAGLRHVPILLGFAGEARHGPHAERL